MMITNDDKGFVRFRFEYEHPAIGLTVLEKEVPEDFLGLTELEIFHEIYKEFLRACTFYVKENAHIELVED